MDEIIESLKDRPGQSVQDAEVDSILAEMGFASAAPAVAAPDPAPAPSAPAEPEQPDQKEITRVFSEPAAEDGPERSGGLLDRLHRRKPEPVGTVPLEAAPAEEEPRHLNGPEETKAARVTARLTRLFGISGEKSEEPPEEVPSEAPAEEPSAEEQARRSESAGFTEDQKKLLDPEPAPEEKPRRGLLSRLRGSKKKKDEPPRPEEPQQEEPQPAPEEQPAGQEEAEHEQSRIGHLLGFPTEEEIRQDLAEDEEAEDPEVLDVSAEAASSRMGRFPRLFGLNALPEEEELDEFMEFPQNEVPAEDAEPAAEGTGPEDEELKRPPRRFPRLFGSREEPSGEGPFAEIEQEEPIEDYDDPGEAPEIQADLIRMHLSLVLRTALTAVLSAGLLYLGLSAAGMLPPITAADPAHMPGVFLGVNLILLLLCMGLASDVMRDGLYSILQPAGNQLMPALAALGSTIQLAVLLLKNGSYDPVQTTLFAFPAALLLCLALAGRMVMSGVVERNFRAFTRGTERTVSYRVQDSELSGKLAAGLAESSPSLLVTRPTGLVRGFLRQSFSQAPGDVLSHRMGLALLAVSAAACVISGFRDRDPFIAVSVLAGTLALGAPLCSSLLAAVSCRLMQKQADAAGAAVPGWSAIQDLGSTNMVMVGAKDLFPSHTVVLHGIETFEKQPIDQAILYAASILIKGCDTLRDVFLGVIRNDTGMLYPVHDLRCEVGCGFTAKLEGRQVILGSRRMMEHHGITLPSLEHEERHAKGLRKPIYLAVDGRMFGMFVVSYAASRTAGRVLRTLTRSGISVLVESDDFSITTEMVCEMYQMPQGTVKVMGAQDRDDLGPARSFAPQSEGCMLHQGTFASMMGGLRAACTAESSERTASLVSAAGVLCSCVLALLLAFTGGTAGLALPAVLLYQCAWSALALGVPLFRARAKKK